MFTYILFGLFASFVNGEDTYGPWINEKDVNSEGDSKEWRTDHSSLIGCTNPKSIECQSVDGESVLEARQIVTCDVLVGFECLAKDQAGGAFCKDYKVRYLCSDDSILDSEQMSFDQLTHYMTSVYAPFEVASLCVLLLCLLMTLKFKSYSDFPGSLFQWVLVIDICYGCFSGPLRWFEPANVFYYEMVNPTTDAGCRAVATVDTFFQMASLYANTAIICSVWYMVFYQQSLSAKTANGKKARKVCILLFWCFTLFFTFLVSFGSVTNAVGWCTVDSIALLVKQIVWYVIIILQALMVIPTNYRIYKSSLRSTRAVSKGTYVRFVGIVITQVLGLFPVLQIEYYGITRTPVPTSLYWLILVGFPLAHMLDGLLLSIKFIPELVKLSSTLSACVQRFEIDERSRTDSRTDNSTTSTTNTSSKKFHAVTLLCPCVRWLGGKGGGGSSKTDTMTMNSINGSRSDMEMMESHFPSSTNNEAESTNSYIGGQEEATGIASRMSIERRSSAAECTSDFGKKRGEGSSNALKKELNAKAKIKSKVEKKKKKEAKQRDQRRKKVKELKTKQKARCSFLFKIMTAQAVPLIVLAVLSALVMVQWSLFQNEAQNLMEDMELAPHLSRFKHEVLEEQGAAGIFIKSNGTEFSNIFSVHIADTDESLTELDEFLQTYSGDEAIFAADSWAKGVELVDHLTEHREELRALNESAQEAIEYYFEISDSVLELTQELARKSRSSGVDSMYYAWIAFVAAKEAHSLRTVLGLLPFVTENGTFGLDDGTYHDFVISRAKESAFESVFRTYAEGPSISKLDSIQGSKWSKQAQELGDKLEKLENVGNKTVFDWYDYNHVVSTGYQDLQQTLAVELSNVAVAARFEASRIMQFMMWILIGVIAIVSLMMVLVTRVVRRFVLDLVYLQRHFTKSSGRHHKTGFNTLLSRGSHNGVCAQLRRKLRLPFLMQILASIVIPMVVLFAVIFNALDRNIPLAQKGFTVSQQTVVISKMGDLFHHMGEERFWSVAHQLPYNATRELLNEYGKTDEVLDDLLTALEKTKDNALQSAPTFEKTTELLESLPAHRQLVLSKNASIPYILDFHKQLDTALYNITVHVANTFRGDSIDSPVLSYWSFLSIVDLLQHQRTEGSIAFTNGAFGGMESYRDFTYNMGLYQSYSQIFLDFASDEARQSYNSLLDQSHSVHPCRAYNDELITQPFSLTKDSQEWYWLMTFFLEETSELELSLATDLTEVASKQLNYFAAFEKSLIIGITIAVAITCFIVILTKQKIKVFNKLMGEYLLKEEERVKAMTERDTAYFPRTSDSSSFGSSSTRKTSAATTGGALLPPLPILNPVLEQEENVKEFGGHSRARSRVMFEDEEEEKKIAEEAASAVAMVEKEHRFVERLATLSLSPRAVPENPQLKGLAPPELTYFPKRDRERGSGISSTGEYDVPSETEDDEGEDDGNQSSNDNSASGAGDEAVESSGVRGAARNGDVSIDVLEEEE